MSFIVLLYHTRRFLWHISVVARAAIVLVVQHLVLHVRGQLFLHLNVKIILLGIDHTKYLPGTDWREREMGGTGLQMWPTCSKLCRVAPTPKAWHQVSPTPKAWHQAAGAEGAAAGAEGAKPSAEGAKPGAEGAKPSTVDTKSSEL